MRKASLVGALALLASLLMVQTVWADHAPIHGTILARGPFTEELDVKVKARIGGELGLVQVDSAADTIFQQITVQPGGFTGWHSHPGPAFVTVAQGTFTYYDGEDETCTGIEYGPGESFVDIGQGHVHSARNEGATVVSLYVMYLDIPPGVGSPFVSAPNPGNCSF
jgi:quercetin dioxygenase-like cupin family protein